jgi:hypothetical protein
LAVHSDLMLMHLLGEATLMLPSEEVCLPSDSEVHSPRSNVHQRSLQSASPFGGDRCNESPNVPTADPDR